MLSQESRSALMHKNLLEYDAGIEKIDTYTLASWGDGTDVDGTRGVTAKNIPSPLSGEVALMNGEDFGTCVVHLNGVTGITAFIDAERGERAHFDTAIASAEVKFVFYVGSMGEVVHIVGRGTERLDEHACRISKTFDASNTALAVLVIACRKAEARLTHKGRIESEVHLVDAGVGLKVGEAKKIFALLQMKRADATPHGADIGSMPYVVDGRGGSVERIPIP